MNGRVEQGGWVIIMSFIIAIILIFIPLPESFRFLRPHWVLLVLIYWMMALPKRVGLGTAWFLGLSMDVMMGGVLGVTAFVYALIAFLVLRFHLQLRQFPLWQQGLWVFSLIFFGQFVLALKSLGSVGWYSWWLPAVTSTLVWPLVFAILRWSRRTFRVI